MNPKLEKLQEMMKLVNESLTREEFTKAFSVVLEFVKKIDARNSKDFATLQTSLTALGEQIKHDAEMEVSDMKEKTMDYCMKQMSKMMKEHDAKMEAMDEKMDSVQDGKDADEEKIVADILEKIPQVVPPETPEDIRDKLESLPEEEKLAIEAIKDLRKELDELRKLSKKVILGGGTSYGVFHVPTHESFTMNGVSTSVTLSQAVAANGNAILALRYNGQVMDMTTHYTVSGNKISLTFTPADGTTISVTYIP